MTPAPDEPGLLLDDDAVDALVAGDPVPAHLTDLAALAAGVRLQAEAPPPVPSEELAALLNGTAPVGAGRRSRRLVPATVGATGMAALALALTGAAAAEILPGPVDDAVHTVVETVTPFDLGDPDGSSEPVRTEGGPSSAVIGGSTIPAAPTTTTAGTATVATAGPTTTLAVPATTAAAGAGPASGSAPGTTAGPGAGSGSEVGGSGGSATTSGGPGHTGSPGPAPSVPERPPSSPATTPPDQGGGHPSQDDDVGGGNGGTPPGPGGSHPGNGNGSRPPGPSGSNTGAGSTPPDRVDSPGQSHPPGPSRPSPGPARSTTSTSTSVPI